ncbi:LCP family protein required for cell wall assembly [Kineococcus xinjiangensis]|uniref:LCP family protein required for cell wall assembly n=1 Tax=Kineococcus xinjiangensis TaxID=512762 RepID=A0A2S6IJ39_9ACTN|nr:LCP family protein required for cell wall assembly [Kineococcus xinjiangensis]
MQGTAPVTGVPGAGRSARGRHASQEHGLAYRLLRAAGVGVLAFSTVGAAGGAYAWYQLEGNINTQDIDAWVGEAPPDEAAADPTTGQEPLNILVMGSDTRDLADGTGGQYGGESADPGARSDTTVLVHLAADRESAAFVSIPRDSMVQIPDCTREDGTVVPGRRGMFNDAFSEAGPACTIKTVQRLTGVPVDHHAVVDFSGFRSMVDALNGVEICLPKKIDDKKANLRLPAGRHQVDGETALAYARVRYIGDGSDISRIARQQALMSSMVQKITSSETLFRPDRLYSFLDAATSSVTTDPDLAKLNYLRKLAMGLKDIPADGVQFVTVPNEPDPKDPNRLVWTPAADLLWKQIRTDTRVGAPPAPAPTSSAAPSASSALTVPPAKISVEVLNVGGVKGAARTAAEGLTGQGFTVTRTGDAEPTASASGVLVRYGPDRKDSAATVAAAFPGAKSRLDPALGKTVVVEVGTKAPAVVDVRLRLGQAPAPSAAPGAKPSAGTTPAPAPTIEARVASDDICA